jgi:hypothetical protein
MLVINADSPRTSSPFIRRAGANSFMVISCTKPFVQRSIEPRGNAATHKKGANGFTATNGRMQLPHTSHHRLFARC